VKRPQVRHPHPPDTAKPSTVPPGKAILSTVGRKPPVREPKPPRPQRRGPMPKPPSAAAKSRIARIIEDDSTVLDLIDNLLSKGVVLNADIILALANVDLVYLRLSALLCAADRVFQRSGSR